MVFRLLEDAPELFISPHFNEFKHSPLETSAFALVCPGTRQNASFFSFKYMNISDTQRCRRPLESTWCHPPLGGCSVHPKKKVKCHLLT